MFKNSYEKVRLTRICDIYFGICKSIRVGYLVVCSIYFVMII